MRFVVFIDLLGTIILPATCAYLGYLIYRVASHTGQFPLISLVMIAAVYGLQAIIFIIKRQWQHVGWMIIYILALSHFTASLLPIYSFLETKTNFSWGNTRIVIGEKGDKKVIATQDEGFDPRSIPLQRWDDYAATNSFTRTSWEYRGVSGERVRVCFTLDDPAMMENGRHAFSIFVCEASEHHPGGVLSPAGAIHGTAEIQHAHGHGLDQSRQHDDWLDELQGPTCVCPWTSHVHDESGQSSAVGEIAFTSTVRPILIRKVEVLIKAAYLILHLVLPC